MTHEGPVFGRSQPAETLDPVDVDATLDQIDGQDADAASAEQEMTWEEDWANTIENVSMWAPYLQKAYHKARQTAGGTVRRRFDSEGDLIPLSAEEQHALSLQPDVLIVDLVAQGRTWRRPLAGEVQEKVALAGWTIARRFVTAEDNPAANTEPDTTSLRDVRGGLLDALEAGSSDDDAPAEESDDDLPSEPKIVWEERVVLMHDGKLVRMVGSADPSPKDNPDAPLRFARKRPDASLQPADAEEDPKAQKAYDKQVALIDEYAADNKNRFVNTEIFDVAAVLRSDNISDTDFGRLDGIAAAPEELTAEMVRQGMYDFLTSRGMARHQDLDYLTY